MADAGPPTALVVDDDQLGRLFLRALLDRAGFAVTLAASGDEALRMFSPEAFDVVFMDMQMPGIDGVETTRRLKAACGEQFTPVIFVTGSGDEQSLVRAIRAGGDDFLVKPVVPEVLLAKLDAMTRIRAIHERTRQLYGRVMRDQRMALEVFDRNVAARNVDSPAVRSRIIPAEIFSGDLLLTAVSPRGCLHVLVGDFTGHGLAAAIGAMPLAETFRSAVTDEANSTTLLERMNRKALETLPRGNFLAAAHINVELATAKVSVTNCGLPPVFLCGSAGIRARFESRCFALGIVEDLQFEDAVTMLEFAQGERVVIATDGVSEAVNPAGEAFGEARLENLLAGLLASGNNAPELICAALDAFRDNVPFADDVSVVELTLAAALLAPTLKSAKPIPQFS